MASAAGGEALRVEVAIDGGEFDVGKLQLGGGAQGVFGGQAEVVDIHGDGRWGHRALWVAAMARVRAVTCIPVGIGSECSVANGTGRIKNGEWEEGARRHVATKAHSHEVDG